MESPERDASPGVEGGETPLQDAIETFVADFDAGSTRRVYLRQLERWVGWLDREHGVKVVDAVDSSLCAAYARHLSGRARDGDVTGGTANTYYDYVSAFLSWCVEWELLGTNPARARRATAALPEDHGGGEQQFWSPETRQQLLAYVDERAHDALDAHMNARARAFRNRALTTLLALTGARGAEVFRDPQDDHRDGLRWRDVDLETGAAQVLGKSREIEELGLADRVIDALDRHRRVQDPPSPDWPVFPTRHRPTLARLEDGEVPPSITVDGGRDVMKRLSEAAELDIDGEYLKPHGGRRGIGATLYRENAGWAQQLLRHESLETTNEAYQDIQAGEIGAKVDEVTGTE